MSKIYRYVVLRLAPDFMRGETMNVGIVLFPSEGKPEVIVSAPLQKLRALDADWSAKRVTEWSHHVRELVDTADDIEACVKTLSHLGYCVPGTPGMFVASTEMEFAQELNEIKDIYVNPKGFTRKSGRERRPRLVSELKNQFKRMQRLGKSIDDLTQHLVVPNVPVPDHPDLKADFVYKNGVYRITQTLDYRVSVQGAHQKISEACTKTIAAQLAKQSWGEDTVKLAVVNIPEEIADIADPHIDMLLAQGFSIYHSNIPEDLAKYHLAAVGKSDGDAFMLENRI